MGPLHTNRLMKDGDTFTDCNYWKQFAYPQTTYTNAFIEVLSDDGSFYSNVPDENTFGIGATWTVNTTSFTSAFTIDFVGTYGAPATFLQVTNNDATNSVVCQLNANTNIQFTLPKGTTQVFSSGDIAITMLQVKASAGAPNVTVIASVRSLPQS